MKLTMTLSRSNLNRQPQHLHRRINRMLVLQALARIKMCKIRTLRQGLAARISRSRASRHPNLLQVTPLQTRSRVSSSPRQDRRRKVAPRRRRRVVPPQEAASDRHLLAAGIIVPQRCKARRSHAVASTTRRTTRVTAQMLTRLRLVTLISTKKV